jgi:VCBS repeat-containing protein
LIGTLSLVVAPAHAAPAAPGGHLGAPKLARPMHGPAALAALNDRLPAAAKANGMATAELRNLLATDQTMWLDEDAALFARDTMTQPLEATDAQAMTGPVVPLSDTFQLHSQTAPGAPTIYLDFDGITLGESEWGYTQGDYDGYDTDGDPGTFNSEERAAIQQVWAQVKEDYAPFFVDVTTEDPGPAALTRTSPDDTAYGVRVAITEDLDALHQGAGCTHGCGVVGLAYVDRFDTIVPETSLEYSGPAWVFADNAGNDPRALADIAAHEVGHFIGLDHTSLPVSTLGASIMNPTITGARVTQWVTQGAVDEMSLIASHGLSPVTDEINDYIGNARRLRAGTGGVISTVNDFEWFRLDSCQPGATISAEPADVGPNLDLRLVLRDRNERPVSSDAPRTTLGGGMGAVVTVPSTGGPGPWYVVVDGVGSGPDGASESFGTGYPDYGSLGAYTLDAVGCDVLGAPPSAPRDASAATVSGTTTLTWRAPASTGAAGSAKLHYEVSLDDGPWSDVGSSTTKSWSTSPARHDVAVRALNPAGPGPAVLLRSAAGPSAPTRVWVEDHDRPGAKYIHWQGLDNGGSTLVQMDVWRDATKSVRAGYAEARNGQVDFSFLTTGTTYWLSVSNALGDGPSTSFVVRTTPVLPGPARDPSAVTDRDARTARFAWTAPVDDGGGPTFGYQVALDDGPWVDVSKPVHSFADVTTGPHVAVVRPVNAAGPGPESPVTFEMPPVNARPEAGDDSYPTPEDITLVVGAPGVVGNDTDADGEALTAVLVAGPAHGSLSMDPDGSFVYTPDANYHGADSFSYRASDGTATSVATVSLMITSVNDAPTVVNQNYNTEEDGQLNVPAPGVLRNAGDVDGDPLSAVVAVGPAHGSLVLDPAGSLTYTPNPNFNGSETFTYRASDGTATSSLATVTIFVFSVNDVPVAGDDSYSTAEDTVLEVVAPGTLGDDADPDGQLGLAFLDAGPSHGDLVFGYDGSFTYTPDPDFHGSDSFTYHVEDAFSRSNVATVSLTVTPVNDAPTVTITPGACTNDKAVEGRMVLTLSDVDSLSGLVVTAASSSSALVAAKGLVVSGTGGTRSLSITPIAKKTGSATITVTVRDGTLVASATVQVLVGSNASLLSGTGGVDAIFDLAGASTLRGLGGADLLCGGTGNDVIEGGDGDDVLSGDAGNDRLIGGDGADLLAGGSGADFFLGGPGADTYVGYAVKEGDTQG